MSKMKYYSNCKKSTFKQVVKTRNNLVWKSLKLQQLPIEKEGYTQKIQKDFS